MDYGGLLSFQASFMRVFEQVWKRGKALNVRLSSLNSIPGKMRLAPYQERFCIEKEVRNNEV